MALGREDAIDHCRRRYTLYMQQVRNHQADADRLYMDGDIRGAAKVAMLICQDAGAATGCLYELNMLIRLRGQREGIT